MKRFLSLTLALLMLICSFTACNTKELTPEEAAAKSQNDAYWQASYGKLKLMEEMYAEAAYFFSKAIQLYPTAEIYYLRAQAYRLQNSCPDDLTSSISDYTAALSLDSSLEDAWVELAQLHCTMGNESAAVEALEDGLAALPENPSIAALLAELTDDAGSGSMETVP